MKLQFHGEETLVSSRRKFSFIGGGEELRKGKEQKRGDLTAFNQRLSLLCVGGASDFRQRAMVESGAGLVLSLAKDGGADAHDRGACLYGYGPVTTHTHRELIPRDVGVALT